MTEKRQFCPKGHDTFVEGRDSSYRCLRCKREGGQAARAARRAVEEEARWAHQLELNEQARRWQKKQQRQIERLRGRP